MPFIPAAISAVSGIAGAFGGGQQSSSSRGPGTQLENQANAAQGGALSDFGQLVNAGANAGDVSQGAQSQRDLAAMLQQYQQSGGVPNAEDIANANQYAANQFGQQRVGLQQSFEQQRQDAAANAALSGRSLNDPVLRNKLAQEQTRQEQMLGAQQNAFSSQFAMQQPDRRLGYAAQRSQALQGLASQALANRQALFSMGNQAASQQAGLRSQNTSGGPDQLSRIGSGLAGGLAGFGQGSAINASNPSAFINQVSQPTQPAGAFNYNSKIFGNIA